MAVYTYKAMSTGADVTGAIAADTPSQARQRLREQGLIVRDIAEVGEEAPLKSTAAAGKPAAQPNRSSRWFAFKPRRRSSPQSTTFIRELSTLLAVGVPLLEALETTARQHRGGFQTALILLRDRVSAGASLASAMRQTPRFFDDLCISITEVGEDAGALDVSLERLAEFRERSEQLKGRLGTALIYPIIVSIVATFSTIFLMTFVVPKILEPLIEQNLPLPWPTKVVKGISDFVVAWGWLAGIAIAVLLTSAAAFVRGDIGRMRLHRFLLGVPLLGGLLRKAAIVRLAVVLSTLLKSGVVFVRALEIARKTTSNRVLCDAIERCENAISAGSDIAAALESTGAFPPMVVQVFALGQQSGRLEEMLDRLATAYDREVATAAGRLAAIIEPVLIVLLAMAVLFIVMATVLPILEAGNAIQ